MKDFKQHLTRHVGHNVLILVMGIVTLLCLVLGVISEFTTNETVAVPETVTVSASPIDAGGEKYELRLFGVLMNQTNEEITIGELLIAVEGDGRNETVVLENVVLPSRMRYELAHTWEGSVAFDKVTSVNAVYQGETHPLANYTSGLDINADLLFYWAIAAVALMIGIYFFKQRYYLAQEDQMSQATE